MIRRITFIAIAIAIVLSAASEASAQAKKKPAAPEIDSLKSSTFSGLKFRNIGPAFTSGRIADFAVNPANPSEYFVAVASGHVWKTVNNGTTFEPVFDNYGSYSIGCVAMDPSNHNVVWIGTGENNHQRALGYGNGVFKSTDGGKSWKNMGLKESRQIGGIVIDPRNTDVVFVAAEGSAWGPGGDRGLYKTTDGGKNWKKVLEISEHTGVNNVVMDPADPSTLYATSEQRRRHVFTKIGGGPESAVYKSTDNGETWNKIMKGLPGVDIGGMGIAVSPVDRNVVYLIVEAAEDKSGFYRSTDRGESWQKMSDHASSGQYYNEIYCDPVDVDKVYSVETITHVTTDAGKTWTPVSNNNRHVDDHALWIDPSDTKHLLIGGDGGIYESYDDGKTWIFKSNLPVTQFYRVQVDNDYPFYNVYGGTQDNNSFGGPSANTSTEGVTSEEWYPILGGDGFWVQIDPKDPNIIYCEYQYGNMYRYDKKSGEGLFIKPQPRKGEKTYKWNWNTPLILSTHSNTRLYAAANKVFRSDDRGESWQVISEDLTSGTDRNTWPVMDHYWPYDAVAKDVSTSLWGTIVSLDESPLNENLIYAGTDDGVLSVTEDGGKNWRQVKNFPGVPEYTYISDIEASKHNENFVYIAFDNILRDDFKPYVFVSTDKGKTFKSISSNLPINGTVHSIEQDFVKPELLFAGTEFGVFFSPDNGGEWVRLSSGIPDVAIKDLTIQQRECDLVAASFGRGFFILDNYSPLREVASDRNILKKDAHIFTVKDALMYLQTDGKYGQGATLFSAPNPAYGAIFTYYLKETPKTLKELRQEAEAQLFKDKKPIPQPGLEQLRKEAEAEPSWLVFTVTDEEGNVVRRINETPKKGINRTTWDFRYSATTPVRMREAKFNPVAPSSGGMYAIPGTYYVSLDLVSGGETKRLSEPVKFTADILNNSSIPRLEREEVLAFNKKVGELTRVMRGSRELCSESLEKVVKIKQTLVQSNLATPQMMESARKAEKELNELIFLFEGPEAKASSEEIPPVDVPLLERLSIITYGAYGSSHGPTKTMKDNYSILMEEFPPVLERIKNVSQALRKLEEQLEAARLPWTPGRVPNL
jgi:photosystem II stability/assembly factor-like uncharacterized protein